jgi:SM-20-related protein
MSRYLDIERFRAEQLVKEPFPYLVMREFVRPEVLADVIETYPKVDKPGSWPLPGLKFGQAFAEMIKELEGEEVRKAFEEKFAMDLSSNPTMITARCMCRAKDGKVHTDSRTKIITVLIYLNQDWENDGGKLRLLRSQDLNDSIMEVPPNAGTIITFLNTTNAWHGHESYSGPRRAIQLNWVTDPSVVEREQKRHRVSGFFKKLNPFA